MFVQGRDGLGRRMSIVSRWIRGAEGRMIQRHRDVREDEGVKWRADEKQMPELSMMHAVAGTSKSEQDMSL